MKRTLTMAAILVAAAILVGLVALSGMGMGSSTAVVRGTVYDLETGLRLGKFRHVPEITKPTCEGRYEVRIEGELVEEGLAVKIVEPAKLLTGEEVAITIRDLSERVVLETSTRSGPPQEGYLEGDFELNLPSGNYWATLAKEGYESKTMALIVPWEGSELEIRLSPETPYTTLSPTLPDPKVVH